ncbi:MAG: acetylglutamate kinase, partial [Candidatus Limnocylindria bacterium]
MSRVVLKCGGAVATGATACALQELLADGHEVCVVHGAGPQISAEMARRELPVRFVGGRRVTTPAALEVVRESLAAVNRRICEALGPRAVGFMGDEIGLEAIPIPELGLVGDPVPSRPPFLLRALRQGLVPVVAPLAKGPLNVNADEAAGALAVGLRARRLLFVSDVPGVLVGGSPLSSIGTDEADRLLREGTFEGGIVPKLTAAVRAVREGVSAQV